MPVFSSLIFGIVKWKSRKGLRDENEFSDANRKTRKQRTGVRGETYAYWYLRNAGYVFVARNFTPRSGAKGELDLVGYDGDTLAFVEVRTRTASEKFSALPELSVDNFKQFVVARTAQHFLAERHIQEEACRFDVLAIDNIPGQPPEVRLHKDAFSPQFHR